jgi:hypothetical protein
VTFRGLEKGHHLAGVLSEVEMRQVRNDYTLRFHGDLYQIERQSISSGLRANVRVERRLDGSLAVRFGERYLAITPCVVAEKPKVPPLPQTGSRRPVAPRRGSDWNKNFDLKKAPAVWQAAQATGGPRSVSE